MVKTAKFKQSVSQNNLSALDSCNNSTQPLSTALKRNVGSFNDVANLLRSPELFKP